MLRELKKKRSQLQSYTWLGLPFVLVGGWFYPKIGFFLLICMAGAIGIAFYKGRAWCDWMCPRGSFYDLIIYKISRKKEIPEFVKNKGFRIFMLSLLFSVLGSQIYIYRGDINKIGLAMVMLLSVTTTAGILLGVLYHQRLWCHICPVGTVSNYLSGGKHPLNIDSQCKAECKLCAKVCPMQLKPYEYKGQGTFGDNDCIKCSTCVAACPKKALNFGDGFKKVA